MLIEIHTSPDHKPWCWNLDSNTDTNTRQELLWMGDCPFWAS